MRGIDGIATSYQSDITLIVMGGIVKNAPTGGREARAKRCWKAVLHGDAGSRRCCPTSA
jgi:hypothetical protein